MRMSQHPARPITRIVACISPTHRRDPSHRALLLALAMIGVCAGASAARAETPPPFVFTWGSSGQFQFPVGIALDGSGNVYVCDNNHRIQKFTGAGIFLTKWG